MGAYLNSSTSEFKEKGQEFKFILCFLVSLRLASATGVPGEEEEENSFLLVMVSHACNLNAQEAEADLPTCPRPALATQ